MKLEMDVIFFKIIVIWQFLLKKQIPDVFMHMIWINLKTFIPKETIPNKFCTI